MVELEWPSRTTPPPPHPPRGTHKQSNSRLNELAAAIVRSDYECFRAHSIRRRSRCQDGFVLAGRSRCSLAGGLTVLCQFTTSLAILSVKKNIVYILLYVLRHHLEITCWPDGKLGGGESQMTV